MKQLIRGLIETVVMSLGMFILIKFVYPSTEVGVLVAMILLVYFLHGWPRYIKPWAMERQIKAGQPTADIE